VTVAFKELDSAPWRRSTRESDAAEYELTWIFLMSKSLQNCDMTLPVKLAALSEIRYLKAPASETTLSRHCVATSLVVLMTGNIHAHWEKLSMTVNIYFSPLGPASIGPTWSI